MQGRRSLGTSSGIATRRQRHGCLTRERVRMSGTQLEHMRRFLGRFQVEGLERCIVLELEKEAGWHRSQRLHENHSAVLCLDYG